MRVLEVGGGEDPLYHPNMDIRELPSVDVVHDMRVTPWPFHSMAFDKVYMSHCLEHVASVEVVGVLKEAYRVLEVDGVIMVRVPDLERIIQTYRERFWSWPYAVAPMFGTDRPGGRHLCGFWKEGLMEVLHKAGFRHVVVEESWYSHAYADLTGEGVKE